MSLLMFTAEYPEEKASSLMLYGFAEEDTEIISYMPRYCCSYCTGLLSKYKHYKFQCTGPL